LNPSRRKVPASDAANPKKTVSITFPAVGCILNFSFQTGDVGRCGTTSAFALWPKVADPYFVPSTDASQEGITLVTATIQKVLIDFHTTLFLFFCTLYWNTPNLTPLSWQKLSRLTS
jgi:hypothetical protein